MSRMVQSDVIRVAILNKFGGIWMDADNIVTNGKFIRSFGDNELVMITNKTRNPSILLTNINCQKRISWSGINFWFE